MKELPRFIDLIVIHYSRENVSSPKSLGKESTQEHCHASAQIPGRSTANPKSYVQ